MNSKKPARINGLDVARALAVLIMILVNFNVVLAEGLQPGWLATLYNALQGKGAAMFVVLAGTGMSMMLKSAIASASSTEIRRKQQVLLKRALFLFVFGLIFSVVWRADILHYYGLFISIGALMATIRSRWLWIMAIALVFIYPFLLEVVDYDSGWDWQSIRYSGFWTAKGFLRNLFINGFHPVVPWLAFVFAGIWLGRTELSNRTIQLGLLLITGTVFILVSLFSRILLSDALASGSWPVEEAIALFGTQPMPPLPFYMISAISFSYFLIALCVMVAQICGESRWLVPLIATGQVALSIYVVHVLVGINILVFLAGERSLDPVLIFLYSLLFCCISVWASWSWLKRYARGPMSTFMRFITG
jgi:uncharacterized membrane protein YeiB